MFSLGWTEVVVILVVGALIFGPKKIPELGSTLGKTLHNFKTGMNELPEADESEEDESAS
jgi:sec-independent protein translocase protein TatA